MATPSGKASTHRDVLIVRYDLKRGDKVPMHTHTKDYEHVTICAKGEVTIDFADSDLMLLLRAGDMIDFADHQQTHEIEASTDAVIYNVQKKLDPD